MLSRGRFYWHICVQSLQPAAIYRSAIRAPLKTHAGTPIYREKDSAQYDGHQYEE